MEIDAPTVWELVQQRAGATPDALAAVDELGRRLTFVDLHDQAESFAAALAERGIGEGDTVSWQLPTRLEALIVATALTRLGVVQNPIIPLYGERETGYCTREVGASLFIVPSVWRGVDYEARARALAAQDPRMQVLVVDHELPTGDPASLPPVRSEPEAVRWVFHTSGTTAAPKGAQHTDRSLLAVARGVGDRLGLRADDRNALVFPFPHIGGIMWLVASYQTGLANIVIERFAQHETSVVLAREGVTLASGVVPMLAAFLHEQRQHPETPLFPAVRAFPGGAMMKSPQLHHDLSAEMCLVGYVGAYGMTEAPMVAMISPDDPDAIKISRDGRPTLGTDLRITDPHGRPLPPGEEGEIRLRGPQVMVGYVAEELNADAFDADGYYRSGDLGRLDEDGYLLVTGRLKDVIIRKGENISAMEIESLLEDHPAVAEVGVVGLPDPALGERCCAAVVLEPGAALTLAEVVTFLEGHGIMRQKFPEQLEVLDSLPRTATGKVQKHELRARILGPAAAASST